MIWSCLATKMLLQGFNICVCMQCNWQCHLSPERRPSASVARTAIIVQQHQSNITLCWPCPCEGYRLHIHLPDKLASILRPMPYRLLATGWGCAWAEQVCAAYSHACQEVADTAAASSMSSKHFDVIVVGGGNAALVAALSAYEAGAHVAILEAAPKNERGGNSRFASAVFRIPHGGLSASSPQSLNKLLCDEAKQFRQLSDALV